MIAARLLALAALLPLLLVAPVAAPVAAMPSAATSDGAMPVVATFSVLGDMVREVGGDAVQVTVLVPVDADAHTFQPRPSDLRAVAAARVVVRNGLGIDKWADRMLAASGTKASVVVTTAGIMPRTMNDDGKTVTDPHAWQDPRLGARYAAAIAEGLAHADPAHADAYRARGKDYAARTLDTDRWVAEQIGAVPPDRRVIVTSHDAFGYFGARYGVRVLAVEGISTEQEPSARALAALAKTVRQSKVGTVFLENMTDPRLAAALAREVGAKVGEEVYSDALSPPNGPAPTYLQMFRHNVPLFVAAMKQP